MKIAVISDIHNRIDHLELAIEDIRQQECAAILFLGDIETTQTLNAFVRMTSPLKIDMVLGNNDFDIPDFKRIASANPQLTIHGNTAQLTIDGIHIGMTHTPWAAEDLAATGKYDFVFCGHTHKAATTQLSNCILANPGEIMGRTDIVSYGILDTSSGTFTIHTLLS